MTNEYEGATAPEEKFRMNAAGHLDAVLGLCPRMLGLCEELAAGKDGALALSSAARLIRACADAALAQLRVSVGETRHRSIIEKSLGSNSKILSPPDRAKRNEEIRIGLERKLDRYLQAAERQKARDGGDAQ
jgi:hypothetical protein